MSQILHIFRKDTRRFWPEICVSLAVLGGLVLTDHFRWQWLFGPSAGYADTQVGLVRGMASLPLLLVVSWWLLITRVIHAERLVGDTQFWVTRPYDWKKLLAAKALFLAVYLYLPFMVAQWVMLARAGFHPAWHVAALLYDLWLITAYVVLPCVALAAVTMNLARMTLTLVGILTVLVGLIFCLSMRLIGTVGGPTMPNMNWIPGLILACLCVGAIGVQYASRRTWVARAMLLSFPLCVYAVVEVVSIHGIERVYAQQSEDGLAQLVYSGPADESFPASHRSDKEIDFGIPVSVANPSDEKIYAVDDVKITLDAADGSRWVSPWEGNFGIPIAKRGEVALVLPSDVYAKFLGKKLSLNLTLAVSEGRVQSSTTVPFPATDVAIAGDGICSARSRISAGGDHTQQNIDTHCRFPLRQPYLRITMEQSGPECHSGGEQWTGTLGDAPADFSIDPVELGANFSTGDSYSYNGVGASLPCPATGATFTQFMLERRTELSLTIPDFELPPMVTKEGR